MRSSLFFKRWRLLLLALFLFTGAIFWLRLPLPTDAQAEAKCSGQYLVDERFGNGARWQFCWEQRDLDGVLLHNIYYTPPGSTAQLVLAQGSISQVHVPYDDNSARFHDITDDGFGNENLNNLTPAECPNGTLLKAGTKNAVCHQRLGRGHGAIGVGTREVGELLSLFSVSTSGEYNYIPVWRFYDDGTMEFIMGATGKLQRFTTNSQFGWPVRAGSTLGTSHIHNYYWRLDFDLGAASDDDIVEEFNYTVNNEGEEGERTLGVSRLTTESGRSIAPTTMRSWQIRDGVASTATGRPIAYHLQPMEFGHRMVGPSFEPWTVNDLYVTTYRECEKYVSHNPTANNCGNHLGSFVNGESLVDADLVLWYGLTFHHVPRDEDEVYMHAHWDGFRLVPRDWTATNPAAPDVVTCAVGDVNCDEKQDASDALFMLQHAVKLRAQSNEVPPPAETLYGYSCDVSGDGWCDAVDAMISLQCAAALTNAFCPGAAGLQSAAVNSGEQATLVIETAMDQTALRLTAPPTVGAASVTLAYDPVLLPNLQCSLAENANSWDQNLCHVDTAAGLIHISAISANGVGAKESSESTISIPLSQLQFDVDGNSQATPQSPADRFIVKRVTVVHRNAIRLKTAIDIDIAPSLSSEQLYLPLIMR